MRYMGSKRRIANDILPIILKGRKKKQVYVEPFCGGCNTLKLVDGKRLASDINPYLIAMFHALQCGWLPPKLITEDDYRRIRVHGSPELKGYAGFTHSFGAKFLSTYRRHNDARTGRGATGARLKNNYANMAYVGDIAYRNTMDLFKDIRDVKFHCCQYYELDIPDKSIIYCDPPYEGTTKYVKATGLIHKNFWQWCRRMIDDGHTVYVSEYNAPPDFRCVWQKDIVNTLNGDARLRNKKPTEKLFTL